MNLEAGFHVTENIRLKRPLGAGGMASVWVGEHLTLRIEVAVKFISPELIGQSPDFVARFNREATAVAKIKSPHVVQVLDHGMTDDGTPYIVMELLEGQDLGARLDREGALPFSEVVEIIAQVAKALTRAHAEGVVHRDIKPDNIFLVHGDEDDEIFAKVLDFGIAKDTRQTSRSVVTVTGTMVGTPAYMSPEQILSGKHVDGRADLWSLGVVAYHAMTGEIPFEGSTLGSLCVAIARGVYQAPSYIAPALPRDIDSWMARALALSPEDRFQTAKDMVVALREAAASPCTQSDEVAPFSRPSNEFGLGGGHAPDWEGPHSSDAPPSSRRAPLPLTEGAIGSAAKRLAPRAVLVGGVALVSGIVASAAITRMSTESHELSPAAVGVAPSEPSGFMALEAPSYRSAAPSEASRPVATVSSSEQPEPEPATLESAPEAKVVPVEAAARQPAPSADVSSRPVVGPKPAEAAEPSASGFPGEPAPESNQVESAPSNIDRGF